MSLSLRVPTARRVKTIPMQKRMPKFVRQAETRSRTVDGSRVCEAPPLVASKMGVSRKDVRDAEIHWEHDGAGSLDQRRKVLDWARRDTPDAPDCGCRLFRVWWGWIVRRREVERRIDVDIG